MRTTASRQTKGQSGRKRNGPTTRLPVCHPEQGEVARTLESKPKPSRLGEATVVESRFADLGNAVLLLVNPNGGPQSRSTVHSATRPDALGRRPAHAKDPGRGVLLLRGSRRTLQARATPSCK